MRVLTALDVREFRVRAIPYESAIGAVRAFVDDRFNPGRGVAGVWTETRPCHTPHGRETISAIDDPRIESRSLSVSAS